MEQDDQPEKPSESGDDEVPETESQQLPKMEPPYRFKLGSSQKKRSKLVQQTDEPAGTTPAPAATPQTPKEDPAPPSVPKRVRLKRSGQMHEDLNGPIAEPPPKRDDEY